MTQEHPTTPPPELMRKWVEEATTAPMVYHHYIAIQAARWGADQELEACCDWMSNRSSLTEKLRSARRPTPPSLKEQALQALNRFMDTEGHEGCTADDIADDCHLIRKAVESLPS